MTESKEIFMTLYRKIYFFIFKTYELLMSMYCPLLGNCYTLASKSMRLRNMPPKRREPPKLYGPIGPNGELQFPPLKPWAEREQERLDAEKKKLSQNKLQKGG